MKRGPDHRQEQRDTKLSHLLYDLEQASQTTTTGVQALGIHKQRETERAKYILNDMVSAKIQLIEKKLTGWKYRVNMLRQVTSWKEPVFYTFGPMGSRKATTTLVPSNTQTLSEKAKKDLIDIMTDVDVTTWLREAGRLDENNRVIKKRKVIRVEKDSYTNAVSITFNKDQYVRKQRGLWSTAVKKFALGLVPLSSTSNIKHHMVPENNKNSNCNDTIPTASKMPTCDKEVNTATPSDLSFNDIDCLEQSVSELCYVCTEAGLDDVGDASIVCDALLCKRTICNHCLNKQKGPVKLSDYTFYCSICVEQVSNWQIEAEFLTEDQALFLRQQPMDMSSNHEANIWHYYMQLLLQHITILPPSIHPKLAAENQLFGMLQKMYAVPLLGHSDLKKDERRAIEQFGRMSESSKVPYVNTPINIEISALFDDYNTNNINMLSKGQQKTMNYILERQDNHSLLTLVRNLQMKDTYSVVAKSFIPKGTSPLEYGGILFTGGQMKSTDIAGAESSITWTVTEHPLESKSVYIQPLAASNYGRFINGARTADYRQANLTIMKIKDANNYVHIRFVANRDIHEGEHLLYWYGDSYSTVDFIAVDKFLGHANWEIV